VEENINNPNNQQSGSHIVQYRLLPLVVRTKSRTFTGRSKFPAFSRPGVAILKITDFSRFPGSVGTLEALITTKLQENCRLGLIESVHKG
jgi:hypothetical protein